ncbi:hypothetical protein ACFLRW_01250 [Acidobacteriota bacterium]
MKFLSFQKIRLSTFLGKIRHTKRPGAITLLSLFIFFVFCTLGMSMLLMSQIYLKVSAYKKNALLLSYASENGIKQGYAFLLDRISGHSNPIVISDLEMEKLMENTVQGGTQIIEKLVGIEIPLYKTSSWQWMSWKSHTDWILDHMEIEEESFQSNFSVSMESEGTLQNFKPIKFSVLNLEMEVFSGYLPLAKLPFLLDQDLTPEQKSDFIALNPVEFMPSTENRLPPQISFSEDNLLPQTAVPQIEQALNINLFQPQSLSSSQLRQTLGLEQTNDPVPEGAYLIQDDNGLGGIFVQGDCDELVLAIEEDLQVLSFTIGGRVWMLKFSLNPPSTQFITPEKIQFFDEIPEGIVIVNGAVHSFGGGIINSSGQAVFVIDKETPCILNGANLTFISSDKITISSHLIHQGLKWEEGIPYIKESKSMLNIFATGKDFFDETKKAGQIVIDSGAPKNLVVNASLTASGNGFSIEGKDKTVQLLGGLQTADYTSNGNTLKVKSDERFNKKNDLLAFSPRSLHPVLNITFLKIRGWNEK